MKKIMLALIVFAHMATPAAATPMTDKEIKEKMAFFINESGFLCAEAVEILPLMHKSTYEVRCIERKGGTDIVDYIFNIEAGRVIKL